MRHPEQMVFTRMAMRRALAGLWLYRSSAKPAVQEQLKADRIWYLNRCHNNGNILYN